MDATVYKGQYTKRSDTSSIIPVQKYHENVVIMIKGKRYVH